MTEPASAEGKDLFHQVFNPEEQEHLLEEDRQAMGTIAGILFAVVIFGFSGMVLCVWISAG